MKKVWKRAGYDEIMDRIEVIPLMISNMMKTSDFGKPGFSEKNGFFCHDHKKEGS